MDRQGGSKGLFIRWLITIALLPVTLSTADVGLFGVRLCKDHRQVLACPYGSVIQFVDVIFSLTTAEPQGDNCADNTHCRRPTKNDMIMHDMYDICIQQPACDVDYRRDWIACTGATLFISNYTEIVYTCVKPDEFSKALPANRTNGRSVNYEMSAEDAALLPKSSTKSPTESSSPLTTVAPIVVTSSPSKPTPSWKPVITPSVTSPPSTLINTESTIILAAVLAFVVFAFCCVACGFAYALKVGRIDKKKLPRCLLRTASELPPDHVYADIDYANMYPRGRFGSSATAETALPSPAEVPMDDEGNAGEIHPQQLLRLPYLEFVDARGHVTPLPRTDPYYFVYDPAHRSGHRIVIPSGTPHGLHQANDPLFRSSSVVLQRHHFPHVVTPRPHHTQRRPHHPAHADPNHVPLSRLCGQQELPDLVHHENHHGSGSLNACFSEHNSDPSGVIPESQFHDEKIRDSQILSTSLPDVSSIKGPRQSTSSGSSLGVGERPTDDMFMNGGNPQTVVSRQVTIDSAFEDDFENNTDESHSSSNHLAVPSPDKRFMMDSHEYLTPVSSSSGRETIDNQLNHHASVSQSSSLSPRVGGDIHKASTKRIRGGRCVALPPVCPSSSSAKTTSTPCSPAIRGNLNRGHSKPNKKNSCNGGGKEPSSHKRREPKTAPMNRRAANNDATLALNVQLLENSTPPVTHHPTRSASDMNVSDLPSSSNGLKFSPSVRV